MAQTHHAAHSSVSSPLPRKKYPLRRSPPRRRLQPAAPLHTRVAFSPDPRPVLVPLHTNLRRLPSRAVLNYKEEVMYEHPQQYQVGSKRKRVTSTNENAVGGGRPLRGSGRPKRLKASSGRRMDYSDDSDTSSMDVDSSVSWLTPDTSDAEEENEEHDDSEQEDGEDEEDDESGEEEDESSDDYLINSAEPHQLQRLRKDELARLYVSAGLSENTDQLTKSEIIENIIAARDDLASLPPSSPPRDGTLSDASSEDDNADTEIDEDEVATVDLTTHRIPRTSLRRRATTNAVSRPNGRPTKGRSMSMGHLHEDIHVAAAVSLSRDPLKKVASKLRRFARSSPTTSTSSTAPPVMQSPMVNRLRSRKASGGRPADDDGPLKTPTSAIGRLSFFHTTRLNGRSKYKQVEFSATVDEFGSPVAPLPKHRAQNQKTPSATTQDELSDLTELDTSDDDAREPTPQPSPRRLRSKDKQREQTLSNEQTFFLSNTTRGKRRSRDASESATPEPDQQRRVVPMRNAKKKIVDFAEADTTEEEDEEDEEEMNDDGASVAEDGGDNEDSLDEVDELVSARSSPSPSPIKRRLRPRKGQVQDEDEDAEDEDEAMDEDGDEDEEEEEEETLVDEPRVLRNGKVVGEEDTVMDSVSEASDEEAEEVEGEGEDEDVDVDVEVEVDGDEDEDAEGDTDAELSEEEVDLDSATSRTLVRLRRDDLVRLCEARELDTSGTKAQLAEALLEWRDNQTTDSEAEAAPSSSATARPPSTARRPPRRKHRSGSQDKAVSPPVLERASRFHTDEPRTPPPVSGVRKESEPDVELDLEELGLEDREIPADKLTKLEKIGSGGFKDVFVGKFRNKKVAISEFRGQLSAMDIKELKLLGGFNHPNIVKFLGVSIPENTRDIPVMIVSELCVNGDLFDYVRNVESPGLLKVLKLMLDIANGLDYLHNCKPSIIHRDCKSSNILITRTGMAKIADFGLAKVKQSTRSMVRSLVGTVNWQAPELWHAHPKYNHKVDVFSCAMVYWEALQWNASVKKFPWEGMNEHAIYEIVGAKKQRPSITGLKKQWCPEIIDLMEQMWAHEHQDRPTMAEVVATLEEIISQYGGKP